MSHSWRRSHGGDIDDAFESEYIPLTRLKQSKLNKADVAVGENRSVSKAQVLLRRSWPSLIFDVALALLPIAFLFLLISAAMQHRKPQSVRGDRILDALLLSPTVFPIVFAAICGRAMKSIALYQSQKGASLRLLEHLSGASSLFSALERVVTLRSFGIVGITTALLWASSPIGGQALSLRLLSKQSFYAQSTRFATYLGPDFLDKNWLESSSGSASMLSRVTSIYLSSLSSSHEVRGSPRDVWGNPKTSIPASDVSGTNSSEWRSITNGSDTSTYANLIGIPLKAFSEGTTSEMVVSSIDMDVRCSSLEFTDTETFKKNLKEPLVVNPAGGGTFPNGTTSIVLPTTHPFTGSTTTFLYVTNASWTQFAFDNTHPLTIFYGSQTYAKTASLYPKVGFPVSLATCNMLPRGLETKVACTANVCQAVAARRVPAKLKTPGPILQIMRGGHFCGMGSSYHIGQASQTEHFIVDGFVSDNTEQLLSLYQVPLAVFETRFRQAMNTFWYAVASVVFATGNLTSVDVQDYLLRTPASVTEDLGPHYVCHWTWFWLGLAIVALLEGLAIANTILRFRTHIPDIFGYVSSLTLANKHCKGEEIEQSSALDGLQRARALGHVRFQLADVEGEEDVGKIAFVPLGVQDELETSRVRINRLYS